jgi:hypothetical protein
MSGFTRRQLLRSLAAGTAAVAGTVVVLARSVVAGGAEPSTGTTTGTTAGPDERADRLAKELPAPPEGTQPTSFLNLAIGGRPGVFRNGGFGGFRNGGRGIGPGWGNGRFLNGLTPVVHPGWFNGGFLNGGFPIVGPGFQNGFFRNF